ncbi:MAG: ABC transporter ATP-binding protein, partial [Gemmatimonadaceae bacterium]
GGGGGARAATPPASSWRDRLAALRYVPALLRLVWSTHHAYTIIMVVLRMVRAFVPLATLWVGKLIIDLVIDAQLSGIDWRRLWELVLIEIAIVLVGEALARASQLVESLLGDLFSNRVSVRLMEHAATLDLVQFEDPTFYDHLERARRQTVGRIGLLAQLLGMGQDLLTLVTLSGALVVYAPWLLVLLVVAVVPSFLGETHFAALGYSLLFRRTPERRQLDYLRMVGASDRTAKEVQLFGLAGWLTDRYRVLADRFYEENKALSVRRAVVSMALSLLGTAAYYAAYALVLVDAVRGLITVGTLTFLAGAFSRSRDLVQRILTSASDIFEQSLYLRDLFLFFEMRPSIVSGPRALPVPRPIREGFTFDDVGFRYPGSERWAVRHVNFVLRPGERLALVGENGAGKTTITKLVGRLYDPTEGRILLDGVDLREYDLASLRATIGVIFQDFVRYDLAFDENVAVGQIDSVRDFFDHREAAAYERAEATGTVADAAAVGTDGDTPQSIRTAAEHSLASLLLPRFPDGYRQMLGRRFERGVDLSGGEWQKVALARAYMRDAQLLVLDEPTAALDARAEFEVFARFSELMHGRMAILISHRFSTVRMADRIVVLKNGMVLEEGTHESLIAHDGLYAELFRMQAAGYR